MSAGFSLCLQGNRHRLVIFEAIAERALLTLKHAERMLARELANLFQMLHGYPGGECLPFRSLMNSS